MTFLKTFNVHFWLKKTVLKKDGTFPIYARITIDGKRADLSTQQTTLEHSWCTNARHIKPKFLGAKEINDVLENIHSRIVLCHRLQKTARQYHPQRKKVSIVKLSITHCIVLV